MLKKLACIGLGLILVITLSGCKKENKINEYDKESNVNITDKVEVSSENIVKKAEFIEKMEGISRYGNLHSYAKYDELLNEIYDYLKEHMNEEEFSKLKEDEIHWIKRKEEAIKNSNDEYIAIDYTSERCYYLISLLDELKYIDVSRLKSGKMLNEMIGVDATKIVFDNYNENSYGFEWGKGKDSSANGDNSIQLFQRENEVYILGKGIIYANSDSSRTFYQCQKLEEIKFNNFNTSKVVDMENMFTECNGLRNLDLSSFDTSKVTDMNEMFSGCSSLTNLDLSNFDTSKVTNMRAMFNNCSVLTNLDVSNFDTSKVTDMTYMFNFCYKLNNLDVSNFNTRNVISMNAMFNYCSDVERLDLSNFNTSKTENMSHMFYFCGSLTNLDVSNFDTSNVTDIGGIFGGCSSLTNLDVSSFDTSKVTDMSYMFLACGSLTNLDVSNFDTSKVTNMSHMFDGCSSLKNLDVSNFDTSKVTNMSHMFYACINLASLDVSNFNTSNVTDMSHMFDMSSMRAWISLTKLDISNFDTSNVINMSHMFNGCVSLTSLDVSNFDTSNVTDMSSMFNKCCDLTSLDLSSFDTSNVTDMSSMFNTCCDLTSLDLSGFDTTKVEDMSCMFYACVNLINLDLSSFDTSNVTNMHGMFCESHSLVCLDLSSFNTNRVEDMGMMFGWCENLSNLNISGNFDMNKVKDKIGMFEGCDKLSDAEKNKILKAKDIMKINKKDILWESMDLIDSNDYTCWDDEFKNPFYGFEQIPSISLDVDEKILCDLDGDNIAEEVYLKVIDGEYDDYLPVKQLYINGILQTDNDTSHYFIIDLNRNDNQLEVARLGLPGSHGVYDVLIYKEGGVKSEMFFQPQTDGYGHIIDSIDIRTGILSGYARVNSGEIRREKPKYKDSIYYSSEKLIFSENYDEIKKLVEGCYKGEIYSDDAFFTKYRDEHVIDEKTAFKVVDIYGERHMAIPFVKLEDGREGYVMSYYANS